MFKPKLREYATKALADRTVGVKTGTAVSSVSPTRVTLKSGDVLAAHTLVWGAGLQGNELVQSLGLELQRGNRIAVGPDLTLADHPEVYVVGDVAAITDSKTGQVLPQLGSVALQSGEHAGETIAHRIAGKKTKPFAYRDKGTMAAIGRGAAVVQIPPRQDDDGAEGAARLGHRASRAAPDERGPGEGGGQLGGSGDDAPAGRADHRGGRIDLGLELLPSTANASALMLASTLQAARSQMAFTLGFHIILASLGVALPAMMLIANYRGLRRNDPDALKLAQRWSKAVAVTFAVGAVTGTVLSFEFGLLWPAFTGRFGEVFGVLFAVEGIFFFLEAIFIAIYIFGWKHLSPWAHFWTGVPVVISGLGGAFSVVAVNSWMNQPQGFSPTTGDVTSVDPWKVIFNPAVPYEVPHMILAAYLVTGFLVASIYAVGMLRGRRDRIHRLGLLIPLTVACIATPIQFAVGDTAARAIAKDQPIKFAAMECVQTTSTDVTEYIFGRCTADGMKGGIGIPGLDSFLVGWSTSTQVIGLDSVPPDDRPPANTLLHWCFDAMVGICTRADRPRALVRDRLVAEEELPAIALVPPRDGGLRSALGRRAGMRVDRDRGRTPAVDRLQRHAHRGRGHAGERRLGHLRLDHRAVHRARCGADHRAAGNVATLARRRRAGRRGPVRPGRRPTGRPRDRSLRVSRADAVAVILLIGVTMYAVFGGADFGAGLWSLLAGGAAAGVRGI